MNLNARELATILAALRYWQDVIPEEHTIDAMPEIFEGVKPLSNPEIDNLCERLNFSLKRTKLDSEV